MKYRKIAFFQLAVYNIKKLNTFGRIGFYAIDAIKNIDVIKVISFHDNPGFC